MIDRVGGGRHRREVDSHQPRSNDGGPDGGTTDESTANECTTDEGSAVVDFVLVAPLLLAVALAVVQLALALYVRSTLTSAAAEGARAAALAGSNATVGERRARDLLESTVAQGVVEDIAVSNDWLQGRRVVSVDITARLPLIGLLGPTTMIVTGHALAEQA